MGIEVETMCKALLVEDSPETADVICSIVKSICKLFPQRQWDVEVASTLQEAIEKLNRNIYDVAVVDLILPDSGDPRNTFVAVRDVARCPLVVLTGMEDDALAQQCVRDGAQDFLNKGRITPDVLGRSLMFAIERHSQASIGRQLGRMADSMEALNGEMAGVRRVVEEIHELCGAVGDGQG